MNVLQKYQTMQLNKKYNSLQTKYKKISNKKQLKNN